MRIKSRIIPEKIAEFLKTQPETGMGYQIVTVFTIDGKAFERVQILNALEIGTVDGNTDIPFNTFEIDKVELTHDKSL